MSEVRDLGFSLPPHNNEAEHVVLGAMIQDSAAVSLAMELLSEEDFYLPENKTVFMSMSEMHRVSTPIDVLTLSNELERIGKLDGIGGTAFLIELAAKVPSVANVRSYIKIVSENSTLRKLIKACKKISENCYKQEDDLPDILSGAEKSIYDIVMQRSGTETLRSLSDVLISTFNYIEKLSNLKGKLSGIPTGFHDLDRKLTGLHGGEFVLIGARPSMGKTAVAIEIAQFAASKAHKHVAIFSLEMPCEQIGMRMMCSHANINMQRVRSGNLSDTEWIKLGDCLNELSEAPMFLDDTPAISPSQLRSRCRRVKMEKGLDMIVLDYLQLMTSSKHSENRQNEVSDISRQLKSIAMELDVPVVACSQLSRRAAKTGENHRPVLSDLRESGAIEQDADVVIFVHRENYYKDKDDDESAEDNSGELIVAKQRNGPVGLVNVEWQKEFARYANVEGTSVVEFVKGE